MTYNIHNTGIDLLLITLQMRVARDTNLVSGPPAVKLFSCYLSWDLDTNISLVRAASPTWIQGDHCRVTVLITIHRPFCMYIYSIDVWT